NCNFVAGVSSFGFRVSRKMANQATTQAEESIAGRLAAFFPGGMSVRIPVRVTRIGSLAHRPIGSLKNNTKYPDLRTQKKQRQEQKPHKNNGNGAQPGIPQSGMPHELSENTVIEYGTAREVLFASALPLEFEDRVHLENADGSLEAEAHVVAVQYHD